jgi:glutathione reductase (NADPH)
MTPEKFDVVILGSNAGIGVTGPVRRAECQCAMIEADLLGGTCPNRGCTPKKVLVAAGHALHVMRLHPSIAVGSRADWAALIDRERTRSGYPRQPRPLDGRPVEVIKGEAAFGRIASTSETAARGEIHRDRDGIEAAAAPNSGAELMITSDEMLSEQELPGSVIFVGSGVVALEFGHVYARAGSEVTILEALPQLLPAMDADAVAHLQAERTDQHLVRTAVSVKQLKATAAARHFAHEGAEHTAEAERVVNGAAVSPMSIRWIAAGEVGT